MTATHADPKSGPTPPADTGQVVDPPRSLLGVVSCRSCGRSYDHFQYDYLRLISMSRLNGPTMITRACQCGQPLTKENT